MNEKIFDPTNTSHWSIAKNDITLKNEFYKLKKFSKKIGGDVSIINYKKEALIKAFRFVREFHNAVDVGAHYGLVTFHLDSYFDNVDCFEIDSNIRTHLRNNIKNFHMENVTVHSCGLGEIKKEVNLIYDKIDSLVTKVDPRPHIGGNHLIKTIDSFSFNNCDFIKLDVEGYEPFVIQGAESTIKNFKPVILIENKNLEQKYNMVNSIDLLRSWGYKLVDQVKKDSILACS
tara:strand:+ start:3155 stop:3847 length:693 start_codon:yes stop_codon:yes gene_type:complete